MRPAHTYTHRTTHKYPPFTRTQMIPPAKQISQQPTSSYILSPSPLPRAKSFAYSLSHLYSVTMTTSAQKRLLDIETNNKRTSQPQRHQTGKFPRSCVECSRINTTAILCSGRADVSVEISDIAYYHMSRDITWSSEPRDRRS
jgi:hypothetical protein